MSGSSPTKSDKSLSQLSQQCPSCQQKLLGPFCHHCGEKKFVISDLSAKKVFQHVFSSITDVDGKFLQSFWLLFKKPGKLTLDYLEGRRKNRLKPFQVLIFSNIVFFLMVGIVGYSSFTTPLQSHINSSNFIHQSLAKRLVDEHLKVSGESREEFTDRFNQRVNIQAKSLVVLIVPMLTLVIILLNYSSPYRFIRGLIFATYFFSFMLLIQSFLPPIVLNLMVWMHKENWVVLNNMEFDWILSGIIFLIYGFYFYLASTRVYSGSRFTNVIRAFVFVIGVYCSYLLYRMVLFFTAFYSL